VGIRNFNLRRIQVFKYVDVCLFPVISSPRWPFAEYFFFSSIQFAKKLFSEKILEQRLPHAPSKVRRWFALTLFTRLQLFGERLSLPVFAKYVS
jgi:hypothetical protein